MRKNLMRNEHCPSIMAQFEDSLWQMSLKEPALRLGGSLLFSEGMSDPLLLQSSLPCREKSMNCCVHNECNILYNGMPILPSCYEII